MTYLMILLAPIFGGLIYGVERVIKARMQNRIGPPLLQPFYDFLKLMDKRIFIIHSYHAILGVMHFVASWVALALLFLGADLLIVIFFHLLSTVILVVAGFSVKSTFSYIGANRELISLLAYEPIFVLSAIGFYYVTGSFEAGNVINYDGVPLFSMILIFISLLTVLPIKLKKSPFDVAEAHQEIVGGAEIEYSGAFFEALYTAKWLEYLFVYSFIFLFAGDNYILGAILAVFTFMLLNLIDNATSRVNFQSMLKFVYFVSLPLAVINLIFLVG